MEWILKKVSSAFYQFVPIVRADDLDDPQTLLRNKCEKTECNHLFEELEKCNSRVRSKKKTSETCDEEMVDFINCLDHCVAKTLLTKLK